MINISGNDLFSNFRLCRKFKVVADEPRRVMASKRLTLSCKVDVENDFPKKNELYWKECTWTRVSDNADCRIQAIDDDNTKELQCDKTIGEANWTRSADNRGCSITFIPEKATPMEEWKCTLQKCMDIREGGCKENKTASECIKDVIVNVTVRTCTINSYSHFTM